MNNKKTIAQTYIQQSMVTKGKGNDGEYISYVHWRNMLNKKINQQNIQNLLQEEKTWQHVYIERIT